MANFAYEQFGMTDLLPLFDAFPIENYLLQSLDIFEKEGSNSIKISFDKMTDDNKTLINDPVKRYSFQHSSTALPGASNTLIELVNFHREDQVSAVDFQSGKRRPGTTQEETLMDIVTEYTSRHVKAHRRTVEACYARALFQGTVHTPYTSDAPIIDYAESFDAPFQNAVLNLTDNSLDVLQIFNGYLDSVNDSVGGLYTNIKRIVVFAGANAYNRLRFHSSLKNAFQYVSPLDDGNIVIARRNILPNVQTFTLPGISVDVIKVTDPLLTSFLAADEMVMIPVFTDAGVYKHVYGPASVDTNLAASGISQEAFSYMYEKERGEREIVSEAGILPINNGTSFTLKIKATT